MKLTKRDRAVFKSIRFWLSIIPQVGGLVLISWFALQGRECYSVSDLGASALAFLIGAGLVGFAVIIRIRLYEQIDARVAR